MTTTQENNGSVDPKLVVEHQMDIEQANSHPDHSVMVKPEKMDAEAPSSEPMSGQADSEHVGELAHPQPLGDEDLYSEPPSSEPTHSQPMSSELVNSQQMNSELVNPQLMNSEPPSSVEHMVISQPMSSELVSSLPMTSSELGSSHPMTSSELVTSHPMTSSELVTSHPMSSELVSSHLMSSSEPVTTTLVHSEPVTTTELMYSHPGNYELVQLPQGNMEAVDLQPVAMDLSNSHHPLGAEAAPNSHGIVGMEIANTQQQITTPETQPTKRRKKKSIVWEHFTIETVSPGCRRACCKVCKQSFAYSTGSKVAGTSHLKRHIAKGSCPVILRQQEKNQLSPYMPKSGPTDRGTTTDPPPPKRRYRTSNSSPYIIFDQDRCRHDIARMIIMHDYPLHMVEHPGFVSFVQNLQPRFDMVSFNIVQGDCVAAFLKEKQTLQRFIEGIPGRVCIGVDMWGSSQSTGYVFVTGQFIDNESKLHRRLLNVVMEPFPDSDTALSHAVGTCLSDWGLDRKLASITFNQLLSEPATENLRALLAVKNPMLLNGQLLIKNCIARTLSNMAQEVLTGGRGIIDKIRASVKYIKTSDSHEEKFLELKQQLQVPTEKSLLLDNITKWNTTYEMLLAASELKEVFSCLDTSDPEYKDAPSEDDWKQAENIRMYLKLLHDAASLLAAKNTPSSNVFFHEVWKIQLELARFAASDDLFVSGMAKPLQDKFHKYWKNSCLILAMAVAMDPRFKMKLVEFSFTKIFGEEAPVYVRAVDNGIHDLFQEYLTALEDGSNTNNNTNCGGKTGDDHLGGGGGANNNGSLSDFDMYIMETTSHQMKSELDQYLEESLLPRVQDFDVVGWWKLNNLKYPTLSKMARDILSVPLSTVFGESVFDLEPKEMDAYRCSLRPETVEALICTKDWLQYQESSSALSSSAQDSKALVVKGGV